MIRAARTTDVPAMVGILEERYRASAYAELGEMDHRQANRLLVASVQRHGGRGASGTLAMVAEHDGAVNGFIIGWLESVYLIGVPLMATDVFFTTSVGAEGRDVAALALTFTRWAEANPRVVEIKMGVVDTFGVDLDRADGFYRRLGLKKCGAIYRRSIAR